MRKTVFPPFAALFSAWVICVSFAAIPAASAQHSGAFQRAVEQLRTAHQAKAEGDWEEARDVALTAFDAAIGDDNARAPALEAFDLAFSLSISLDERALAQTIAQKAVSRFSDAGDTESELKAVAALGEVLRWRGELADAEKIVRDGIQRYAAQALDAPEVYVALQGVYGMILHRQGRYDEGVERLRSVVENEAQFARASLKAQSRALIWLARLYRVRWDIASAQPEIAPTPDRGDLENALLYAKANAALYRTAGRTLSADYADALDAISRIERSMSRKDDSIAHLREALDIFEQLGRDRGRDYILLASFLSYYLADAGGLDDALMWGERAALRARSLYLRKLNGPSNVDNDDQIYLTFATVAHLSALSKRTGDNKETSRSAFKQAFSAAQIAALSRVAAIMETASAQAAQRSKKLTQSVSKLRSLQAEWRNLDKKSIRLTADLPKNSELLRETLKKKRSVDRRIRRFATKIDSADKNFSALWNAEAVGVDTLQHALKDDEAYILLTTLYTTVHIFAVTKTEIAWRQAEFENGELCRDVAALRNALTITGEMICDADGSQLAQGDVSPNVYDRVRANRLYGRLFGPVEDVIAGKSRWTITSNNILASLPIGALVVDKPDADASFAQTQWLGRRKALMMTPSPNALVGLRGARSPTVSRADAKFLITAGAPCVGNYATDECDALVQAGYEYSHNPAARPSDAGEDRIAQGQFHTLPELPGAYRELTRARRAIAAPGPALTGSAFTEKAVKQHDWSHGGVLLVATHAVGAGEYDLTEPALVATPPRNGSVNNEDGLLTSGEIARLSMPLGWVVLSGCSTVSPDGAPRSEIFSGLALGFLNAGVRALMMTHFEVRDDVAARLTPTVLQHYFSDPPAGKAEALRLAIDQLLEDETASALHSPSAWATYVVLGAER